MSVERRFANIGHQHTLDDFSDWGMFPVSGATWSKLGYIKSDGVMEIGKYLDWHESADDADDYDFRMTCVSGVLHFSGDLSVDGNKLTLLNGLTLRNDAIEQHASNTDGGAVVLNYYGYNQGHSVFRDIDIYNGKGGWLAKFDGSAANFTMYGSINANSLVLSASDTHITLYETDAADPADRAWFYINSNTALLAAYDNSVTTQKSFLTFEITSGLGTFNYASGCTGETRVGNLTGTTSLYTGGSTGTFVAANSDVSTLVLYSNSGANTRMYVYSTGSYFGLLAADGGWGLQIAQSGKWVYCPSGLSAAGSIYMPSNAGLWLDAGASSYIGYNGTGAYGTLLLYGSKGGWSGIYLHYNAMSMMFDSGANGGFYDNAVGWRLYYSKGDDCWAVGSSGTSSSYRMYVHGSAYSTGSWATSDARKKTDVTTISGALDKVCSLRGVRYRWKDDADVGQDTTKQHLGVIAQELEVAVPEVVNYAADADVYAVDYNGLVGLLIEAVKELKEKIDGRQ